MVIVETQNGSTELPYNKREAFFRSTHSSLVGMADLKEGEEPVQVTLRPQLNPKTQTPEVYVIVPEGLPQESGQRLYSLNGANKSYHSLMVEDVRRENDDEWMGPAMVTGLDAVGLVAVPLPENEVSSTQEVESTVDTEAEPMSMSDQEMADAAWRVIDGIIQKPPEVGQS